MKILFMLSALCFAQWVTAQTDSTNQSIPPATTIASPDAGVADKNAADKKESYKIEPEKNAEKLEQIKQRRARHEQKTIKKYKGKKADTSRTQ